MSTQLSKNFTLEELIESSTASRRGIDNTPNAKITEQLTKLANEVLQPIREKFGKPIHVNSGYRCPKLNTAVGGAKSSQHMLGQAADIRPTSGTKVALFNCIKDMIKNGELKVGQLIWEYGSKTEPQWIHVSLPYRKVNQILYLYSK